METSNFIALVSAIVAAIGAIFTAIGLIYAAIQLKNAKKIARSEFLIHLYELMDNHNELHVKLTGSTKFEPESREDWIKIGRLMGLFEYICILVKDGVIDIDTVDKLYSYRIVPLVNNEVIYERHLKGDKAWKGFKELISLLEKKEWFNELTIQFRSEKNNTLKEATTVKNEKYTI